MGSIKKGHLLRCSSSDSETLNAFCLQINLGVDFKLRILRLLFVALMLAKLLRLCTFEGLFYLEYFYEDTSLLFERTQQEESCI